MNANIVPLVGVACSIAIMSYSDRFTDMFCSANVLVGLAFFHSNSLCAI